MVNSSLEPINLAAAALIAHFCLLTMIFVASVVLRSGEQARAIWEPERPTSGPFFGYIAACTLFTVGCLGFTEPLLSLWRPLFGSIPLPSFGWAAAITLTFSADIILVAVLVGATGGSSVSPFNPIYFLVPVLAIFLREPLSHILFYVALVFVCYSASFFRDEDRTKNVGGTHRRLAYWIVSSFCFALSTVIGIITRVR